MEMEVTIRRGKITMDVIGGHGGDCEDFTRPYENRLAEGPVDRQFKPEHDVGGEDHHLRVEG